MPDYGKLLERLSRVLVPVSEAPRTDAAVALLLKSRDQDLKVLLVKRVETPSDPWSGQIALPGGKTGPDDEDIKCTAIRETLEETNINLLYRCRFLGLMDALTSMQRLEMRVLPFVVLLEHEPSMKLNYELKEFVWVSLGELRRHGGSVKFSSGKQPAFIVGDYRIWGLTYRILEKFIQILEHVSKEC